VSEPLTEAVKTLHLGQVVAHATETCYGLAVDIFQKKALQRLYSLKKMPISKPVSVLVSDLEEAATYGVFSEKALKLAKKHWPGPLTLVVPRKNTLPAFLNPGHEYIGFRVSSNGKTRKLLEAFGGPITTTSANLTGLDCAYKVQDFMDQGLWPDFIIDSGQIGKNQPSTVVRVDGEVVEVLREGSIEID